MAPRCHLQSYSILLLPVVIKSLSEAGRAQGTLQTMLLCQWPSTGWSGWQTAPATLVRLPAFSMRDTQRRIPDCGLWRFCSTVTGTRRRKRVPLTEHPLDVSLLHTLDLKDITTANTGSPGHHLLPTVCCLWELQLPVLHCNEGRQRGLSISHGLERS